MSLVHQQVGSYRLVRKLRANYDYKVYEAVHIRSSEKRIIQLAKLEDKLLKKENRVRLKRYVESIRAINSPYIIPILKYDIAKIQGKNYFYVITPRITSVSLKEWLQLRGKTKPLSQQDADDIMQQAQEAVEVFHKLGIAHLNIELPSFIVEATENPNRPPVILNDFLLAVLSTARRQKDKVRGKVAITEDQNALRKMEKLLNEHVEETFIEPEKGLEATILTLEQRLVFAEQEKVELQRQLSELELEKERIIRELQAQREEERRRLVNAEEEKEHITRDLREQKERNAQLLAEAALVTTGASGAAATPIAPAVGSTSRWTGRWFWALGSLLLLTLLLAETVGLFFLVKPAWAFGSSSAKVTITQAAYALTDSYIFTGVTHSISQIKTQSIMVPATNVVIIPGISASGTLTFHNTHNPCNVRSVIPAGAVFSDSQGISVATNNVALLGASCTVTVAAHAVKIGPIGNIGAHAIRQTYHRTIIVDNPAAFIGGRFDQSYTTVQQSDIDHAASSLAVQQKQKTLNALRLQLQTSDQFVSSPRCKSKVTSDHQVNDATTNLTVTVTETCTAEVYNSQQIKLRSEQMLNKRAQTLFGPTYMLKSEIKAEITHVASDVKQGTLITSVASGLWIYQFSRARADQLARLVTDKDRQDAQSILSDQKGVQSVNINISNNDNTMPGNVSSIKIVYVTALVLIEEG